MLNYLMQVQDNVFAEVVGMIADRHTRQLLGFPLERCIHYRIVPCRLLPLELSFEKRLRRLYPARINRYVNIDEFKRDTKTIVHIAYIEDYELFELTVLNDVNIKQMEDETATVPPLYAWTFNERRSYLIGRFSHRVIFIPATRGTRVYKMSPLC